MKLDDILPQILDNLPIGVYVIDAAGHPYYANQAALSLLGQGIAPNAATEDLSRIYQLYICGTNTPYPTDELPVVRALRGESGCIMNMEIRRPDKTIPIQVWYNPVYDHDHHITYAIAAFQDLSEELISLAEKEELKKTQLKRDKAQ